jgi:hypothetical protein
MGLGLFVRRLWRRALCPAPPRAGVKPPRYNIERAATLGEFLRQDDPHQPARRGHDSHVADGGLELPE